MKSPNGPMQVQLHQKPKISSFEKHFVFDTDRNTLLSPMKYLLLFGKLIGLIPCKGYYNWQGQVAPFRNFRKRVTFSTVFHFVIIVALFLNVVVQVIVTSLYFRDGGILDTLEIAENVANVTFYITGFTVYILMYSRKRNFVLVFENWRLHQIPNLEDKNLGTHGAIICAFLIISTILQNGWSQLNFSSSSAEPILKGYYNMYFPKYGRVLSYNPILTVFLFLCDKWTVYGWTFGDALIAIMAYSVYRRFKLHFEMVLDKEENLLGAIDWIEIIEQHGKIVIVFETMAEFLNPFIFVSTASNFYYISISLNRFLTLFGSSFAEKIIAIGSFLQLLSKTLIVLLCCAKVSSKAHKLSEVLERCPLSLRTKEVKV